MVLTTYNSVLCKIGANIVVEHCPYFDNYKKYRDLREQSPDVDPSIPSEQLSTKPAGSRRAPPYSSSKPSSGR